MPDGPWQSPARLAIAVGIGLLLGLAFGWLLHPSSSDVGASARSEPVLATPRTSIPPTAAGTPLEDEGPATGDSGASSHTPAEQRALLAALKHGTDTSASTGTIQAAVMLDGSQTPLTAGAELGVQMRTWSMVKLVTTLALLDASSSQVGNLDPYIDRALTRSDNCAQRKLVLALHDHFGNWSLVKQAVQITVGRAGGIIDMTRAQMDSAGEAQCIAGGYQGLTPEDAKLPSLLLGTTEWRVTDAVRVAHALRERRRYGTAVSDYVLGKLRDAKGNSEAPGAAAQLTAPPNWGAGQVFAAPCWKVAYKSGWGGVQQQRFLAGQMGTVDLANGRWAAFAVMFHPAAQPPDDDPGKAQAPVAIGGVLTALKQELRRALNPNCP